MLVQDQRCDPTVALARARTALAEAGDGSGIHASWGGVTMPHEAGDVTESLVLADRRMYVCKDARKRGLAVGDPPDVGVSVPEGAFPDGPRRLESRSVQPA